jgi:hypothetical protein
MVDEVKRFNPELERLSFSHFGPYTEFDHLLEPILHITASKYNALRRNRIELETFLIAYCAFYISFAIALYEIDISLATKFNIGGGRMSRDKNHGKTGFKDRGLYGISAAPAFSARARIHACAHGTRLRTRRATRGDSRVRRPLSEIWALPSQHRRGHAQGKCPREVDSTQLTKYPGWNNEA